MADLSEHRVGVDQRPDRHPEQPRPKRVYPGDVEEQVGPCQPGEDGLSGGPVPTAGVCVALVKDNLSVYSEASTGHPATDFTTDPGGVACPNANDSAGRGTHVQVTAQRTGKIEALVLKWNMALKSNANATYEG